MQLTETEREKVKKTKNRHRQQSENQESLPEVSKINGLQPKKKKLKNTLMVLPTEHLSELNVLHPKKKNNKNKPKNTLMVLPMQHLTESSLGDNSVMVEQQKSKKKKRKTEQHPHLSTTRPVLVEMEGPKNKKRKIETIADSSPMTVVAEVEKKKKKKKRTEQVPDSLLPVVATVEKKKKKKTVQVPVPAVAEVKQVEKKKKKPVQVPSSLVPVVASVKKKKKKKPVQVPSSLVPVVAAVKKKKKPLQVPVPPVPVVAEVSQVGKKKKKKQPVGAVETVSRIQNTDNQHNGENVAIERKKRKKKKQDGAVGVANERMSERPTDVAELITGETQNGVPEDLIVVDEIEQMREFIPNIRSKSPGIIRKLLMYDLDRFKAFKSQGIPLRKGRFTAVENERLNKNVSAFLALTGLQSGYQLFHPGRFKDKFLQIRELCAQHKFHHKIAEGIPRPWHVVYERGRKMFNDDNYKGSFTEEELNQLKRFQTLHGNNWGTISGLMDRSSPALEKRFNQIASNSGPWTGEEIDRLMDAVKEHLQGQTEPGAGGQTTDVVRKEKLYKDLPWDEVSYKVQTRSWTQCRAKWLCSLKHKMSKPTEFSRGGKGDRNRLRLIERLYAMQVEDPAEIDWEEVSDSIGNVTPYYIQRQFFRMKVTRVPLWQRMSHCDLIDFLYKNVRPVLMESVERASKRGKGAAQTEPSELYRLSDIFSATWKEVNNVIDASLMTESEEDDV